jgi:hypothetical protein
VGITGALNRSATPAHVQSQAPNWNRHQAWRYKVKADPLHLHCWISRCFRPALGKVSTYWCALASWISCKCRNPWVSEPPALSLSFES